MKSKNAEILCIGTELLMGDIVNTNAAFIAKKLTELGITMYHQTVVGDNPERLKDALSLAFSRADTVITTGGLGPTYDDLTKETIAKFFERKLVMDKKSLESIVTYYRNAKREMPASNVKQAMMPEGAVIFENPNGTAPGCAIDDGTKKIIMLPGPPREMEPMFEEKVVPFLLTGTDRILVSHNLHFYGIGESLLETKLHDLMKNSKNPTIAPYAKTGEVTLRVTALAYTKEDAEELISPVIEKIKETVGEYVYGIDVDNLQTAVVRTLEKKGLLLATAESCTGGLISKRITEVSGASSVFECGVCSYSNRIKNKILSVKENTLQEFSAVSSETALEMAKGIRTLANADIGVSVTGNAGPNPSEGKEVGLVYIGVDSDLRSEVFELNIKRRDRDLRELIRYLASSKALHLVLETAKLYPDKETV